MMMLFHSVKPKTFTGCSEVGQKLIRDIEGEKCQEGYTICKPPETLKRIAIPVFHLTIR
jgi:hypothetical protein